MIIILSRFLRIPAFSCPRQPLRLICLIGCVLESASLTAATIDSPSPTWTSVMYSSTLPDPYQDQQTGQQEGDLVGNLANAALLTRFEDNGPSLLTDGVVYYRLRLGGAENPPGYSRAAFVGIDANGDGALDAFVGVDNSGSGDKIGIWDAGISANISPSTTSIASTPFKVYSITSTNYNWRPVALATDGGTSGDLDGGTSGPDYYLSFSVPLADLVNYFSTVEGMTVNQNTAFHYVFATATQANSLNQDIGALNGGVNSTSTWTSLGAISNTYTAGGVPVVVPEPSTLWLLACFAVGAVNWRRTARSGRGA